MATRDDDTNANDCVVFVSSEDAHISELIGNRYRILRWLGGGGMGRVYAVRDNELGEDVALKMLRAELDGDAIARFRREVRLTRKIQHRNVARMFDIGEYGGERFLTMELVDGHALSRERVGEAWQWRHLRPIAEQIAAGLAAAHRLGVIHRDLKPDNILIEDATARVVITDFGIARSTADDAMTQVGMVIGTPRYMAPEQLVGRAVDARADVYAFGVMMFELATGTRWNTTTDPIEVALARASGRDPLPTRVVELLTACLELDPARRPADADELSRALAGNDEPGERDAPGPPTVNARPSRPAIAPTHSPELTTVAVLPVARGPGDDHLADGVQEDLTDTLSTSPGLRVRPPGAVRSAGTTDARELGKRLEVDHVVEATVRRTTVGLRVAARLISVADGFQVWAHRADCSEAEILAVSDSLAHGIAAALSTRASTGTKPTDPRAVDLYLRARAELRRFWVSHVVRAVDMLVEALTLAPTSPAILGAYAFASTQAWVLSGKSTFKEGARAAIARGLATGHGEAYLASAIYKLNVGDHAGAAADLAIALVRAPMSAQAHETAGRILLEVDTGGDGRRYLETAISLDPGRTEIITCDLARLDALQGNWESADARLATLTANPDRAIAELGAVYVARLSAWRGDREAAAVAAIRLAARRAEGGTGIMMQQVADALARGQVDDAQWAAISATFRAGDQPARQRVLGDQLLAEVAMLVGNPTHAIAALEMAATHGLIDLVWLDRCLLLAPLAELPGFRVVRADVAAHAARVRQAFHVTLTG